jgi:hypothetical protein
MIKKFKCNCGSTTRRTGSHAKGVVNGKKEMDTVRYKKTRSLDKKGKSSR